MINRALRLWRCIEKFYSTKFSKEKDFPTGEILSENDWDELEIFKNLLYLFYYLTMRLQGNSKTGSYRSFLSIAINTRLNLTQKYYELITGNPVYAAIVVLNPTRKWHYLDAN